MNLFIHLATTALLIAATTCYQEKPLYSVPVQSGIPSVYGGGELVALTVQGELPAGIRNRAAPVTTSKAIIPRYYVIPSSEFYYPMIPTHMWYEPNSSFPDIKGQTWILVATYDWDKDTNKEVLFSDVLFALNTCWSYPDAYIDKRLYYKFDCDSWVKKIYDHLAAGHPVLFEASNGETSHVAVIDGYQDGYMFHFNWGDRDVSLNDYYDIRNPRGFSSNQQAIFNVIAPPTNSLSPVPESAYPALCRECEVYNLSGICMGRFPDIDNAKASLPAGIYIVKAGASVSKILIR